MTAIVAPTHFWRSWSPLLLVVLSPTLTLVSPASTPPISQISDRERSIGTLVDVNSKAVVQITVYDASHKEIGQGSGFIISPDGEVLTNHHVIGGASSGMAEMNNGAFLFVDGVLAADAEADLALIKVSGKDLPFIKLGDSDSLKVGDRVVAIGSPLGLENTVSDGLVSAIRKDSKGRAWIQISAPVSPGNSGGPLLNMKGEAVGVIAFQVVEGQNLNFAAPIQYAQRLLRDKHDLVPLAGATANPKAFDWVVLATILGRSVKDLEVQNILTQLNGGQLPEPKVGGTREIGEIRMFSFPEVGVFISFDSGLGSQVTLYGSEARRKDGQLIHSQFQGILPFGFSWTNTRAQITGHLGPPDRVFQSSQFKTPIRTAWSVQDTYEIRGRSYSFAYKESGELIEIQIW